MDRYMKGMRSTQRSILDPVQAAGYDLTHPKESAPQDWGDFIELLTCYSKGKTWPKWNAVFFALITVVYCFFNSYSILLTLLFTGIAAFCGYAIIGIAVVSAILLGVVIATYLLVQLINWIW